MDRNLKILEKENVIETKHLGRIRMIELNGQNPKTQALIRALSILKNPTLNNTIKTDKSQEQAF